MPSKRSGPPEAASAWPFALLLYTGQRRSDVVRMFWRDVEGDSVRLAQQKTKTKIWVPLHPDLKALLADCPREHVVILITKQGKPPLAAGLGNWMTDKIAAAGLPDERVTHGLRKAAARCPSEAGCSSLQIMAVTGDKSLSEVERYTRAAHQKHLAEQAIAQVPKRNANTES